MLIITGAEVTDTYSCLSPPNSLAIPVPPSDVSGRRLTRPAHSSCPYPGDEWRKLPPHHQQEGAAATGPGAKPKHQNTKRRRPHHQNMNRHGSTKLTGAS